MTKAALADLRIAKLEEELAQRQTQVTYRQIEAGLVRRRLKETLDVAIRILDRAPVAGAITGRRHDGGSV